LHLDLQAQNLTRYQAEPAGSKVKIDGNSTVHEWSVESLIIGGYLELDPALVADPQKSRAGQGEGECDGQHSSAPIEKRH